MASNGVISTLATGCQKIASLWRSLRLPFSKEGREEGLEGRESLTIYQTIHMRYAPVTEMAAAAADTAAAGIV